MITISELPTELYAAIFQHVDREEVMSCILALTRAAPYASIPTKLLFEKIRLRRRGQVASLYRRLKNAPQDAAVVRTFAFESWDADADILVNLLEILPNIHRLSLFVGPYISPEHLDEVFAKPRPLLKSLSLRFRP